MKQKIAIIADDLTGACDTGIKFRNLGWQTTVLVDAHMGLPMADAPQVLCVNTDTRSADPDSSRETVRHVLNTLQAHDAYFYYKKVDSVLRGNILSELEAFFQALPAQFALIAPAFPETGRRMRGGKLYLGTQADPPMVLDAVAEMAAATDRQCACIGLKTVRQGRDAVVREAERQYANGCTLLWVDTWISDDLLVIAQAADHFASRCIPVGSAGLAQRLALLLQDGATAPASEPWPACSGSGAMAIVIGTRHPVTVQQVQRLSEAADLDTYLLQVDNITPDNAAQRAQDLFPAAGVAQGRDILLTTDSIYHAAQPAAFQLQKNVYNRAILDSISQSVQALLARTPIRSMIVSGGDVASEILHRLRCTQIQLLQEPLPGIVVGHAMGPEGQRILLATKSGGFGEPDALVALYRYMRDLASQKV